MAVQRPNQQMCRCGQPFDYHPDESNQFSIDKVPVCSDCYYKELGDEIEKHPIHTPGRKGPGGIVDVSEPE